MQLNIDMPDAIESNTDSKKEMLTVVKRGDTTRVYLNPSSLSVMQSCPRKAQYTLDLGLKSKNESTALLAGTAIHAGLEVFYKGAPKDRQISTKIEEHMDLLTYNPDLEGYEGNPCVDAVRATVKAAEPLSGIEAGAAKSIEALVWTIKHYIRTYIDDPFVAYTDSEGPVIERRVEYLIHSEPGLMIYIHGTIDIVLKNVLTGNIVIADHKTTSRLGSEFYNRLKPNHQYTAYILGAQKCMGLTSSTFIVNGIEMKAKPKTSRGTPPKFIRQPTTRNDDDIEEFKLTVVNQVKDYLARLESGKFELGSVNECAMWGGCTFLPVCSAPSALRDAIIDNKYHRDSFARRPGGPE